VTVTDRRTDGHYNNASTCTALSGNKESLGLIRSTVERVDVDLNVIDRMAEC